jgi:hypothetical protein
MMSTRRKGIHLDTLHPYHPSSRPGHQRKIHYRTSANLILASAVTPSLFSCLDLEGCQLRIREPDLARFATCVAELIATPVLPLQETGLCGSLLRIEGHACGVKCGPVLMEK